MNDARPVIATQGRGAFPTAARPDRPPAGESAPLGDAIHTMTPGHGVGANTALRDAALLCRQLTESERGSKPLLRAIADYEAEMMPYGFARVADSLAQNGSSGNDTLYKPVTGRIMLAATRTYFRAVDRIPAFKRKFLDDLYTYRGS